MDAETLAREMMLDCMDAARELEAWLEKKNKSAGRRARALLDEISKKKAALRRAMVEADKQRSERWAKRSEGMKNA